MNTDPLRDVVKEQYGQAARRVRDGAKSACCGGSPETDGCCDPITSNLYETSETAGVPEHAVNASLGCGNPTALAELKQGC